MDSVASLHFLDDDTHKGYKDPCFRVFAVFFAPFGNLNCMTFTALSLNCTLLQMNNELDGNDHPHSDAKIKVTSHSQMKLHVC